MSRKTSTSSTILVSVILSVSIVILLIEILSSLNVPVIGVVTKVSTTTSVTTDTEVVFTSTSDSELYAAFTNHLLDIQSGNLTLLKENYIQNATFVLEGNVSMGLQGIYNGSSRAAAMARTISGFANETLTVGNFTDTVSGAHSTVNFTLLVNGTRTPSVPVTYVISIQIDYETIGNAWLISNETWNMLSFKCFAECCLGCAA